MAEDEDIPAHRLESYAQEKPLHAPGNQGHGTAFDR
jgi:hypothetical protein